MCVHILARPSENGRVATPPIQQLNLLFGSNEKQKEKEYAGTPFMGSAVCAH